MEGFGEWRPEASELLRPSTESFQSGIDKGLSTLRRSKKRTGTVHRDSLASTTSEGTKRQGIVKTQVELIEGGDRSSVAGASPYRALPPFVDEDWKGIPRRPST